MNASDNASDKAQIQKLLDTLIDAWNDGDAEAYTSTFAEDVEYISFDGTRENDKEQIRDEHQVLFDKWLKGSRLSGPAATIRFLSSDVALIVTYGEMTMRGKSKPAPERTSAQTITAVRTSDGWRLTSFQNTRVRRIGTGARGIMLWLVTDLIWKLFGGTNTRVATTTSSV